MKSHCAVRFALALACLAALGLVAQAQVILNPNTIRGTIRFSNANPDVLALLNEPGNEGMKFAVVSANSLPPAPAITASTEVVPPATKTSASYEITVDSDAAGIAYGVTPGITLLDGAQAYYFASRNSDPVVAGGPPVTLDFEECVGVVTVRFVNGAGAPVPVDGGQIIASGYQYQRSSIPAGSTEARIYLLGGQAHPLAITVNRGTDFYVDRLTFALDTEVTVNCDEFSTVDMVLPDTGDLGTVSGQVDMLGEFELTIDGRDDLNYPDSTGVIANFGPFANQRWAALKGKHFSEPSSGDFVLQNVAATTLDPNSPGYQVFAQMFLRTGRRIQSFRSPALGAGANAALKVNPGEGIDVGDLFVINPGFLRGKVLLQGPPETPDRKSLLRGLLHAGDDDVDRDGVPDVLGTYGVYWSSVGAEGVDRLAEGASLTASYGYAYADFEGDFNAANSAYEGNYELALGGLKSERSLWRPVNLSILLSSPAGAPVSDYFYNSFYMADGRKNEVEIVPGQAAAHDIGYCLSEVRIVFRSTSGKFYNPQVRFSRGSFSGTDFQNQPADYTVYLDIAAGTPYIQAEASNVGVVVIYLPQGTYQLSPFVTPEDSTYALTGLEPIDLTVGCGQRIEIEQCLRVDLPLPSCGGPGPLTFNGAVRSCANKVSRVSYKLNDAEPVTVCTDCGVDPAFSFQLELPAGPNTLTVTAVDEQGGTSSITTGLELKDTAPPTIACPADITTAATRPCGAEVTFAATATDACDPNVQVVCTPPSGSLFPPGENLVTCKATDAAGNSAECTFKITVAAGQFPAPTITEVSPKLIAIIGGTQLTVRGANFTIDDEVLLDGQPLLFPVFVSDSELTGQAPALAAGTHELQIRRCGEILVRLENACESGGLPRIFFVDPRQAFARGGSSVVVRGANFTPETKIRIAFPAADGAANLLRNATVAEDGTSITGEVPPLPADELLGPRDVLAEDPRGQDILPGGLCYFPNPTETDPQVLSLRELQIASTTRVEAEWRNGFPSGLLARVPVPGATPEERALAFVSRFDDLLQVQDPDVELAVASTASEGLDDVKLAQSYRGVPIFGSEIVVTLDAEQVVALTGTLLPLAELDARGFDVAPALTPEQAVDATRRDQDIQQPVEQLEPTTELMIYDQCLFTTAPLDPHLVWKVKMNFSEFETLVDARTGEIVARLPLYRSHGFDLDIQDAEREANAQADSCFNLSDDTDVADEDDFNSDYNGDLDAVLANRFARDCWFYFHDVFGWHSYDNNESQLEVFIHTTMNPGNVAQWSQGCDLMQFTDGAVDYEILVHEFTHGVVASTSRLVYQFQSGALDESYADTMAVIADRERGEQENPGAPVNWTIGENIRMTQTRPNGTLLVTPPIRSFDQPRTIGVDSSGNPFPDRMPVTVVPATDDSGGVHYNSGIPNKAGYLMIEGGSFQGFLVRGMGADKTRHVKFWALRVLPRNASFADARAREIAAAEGFAKRNERGFTSQDVCTVRNAWAAVGVGLGDSDCDGVEDTRNDTDGDLVPNKIDNCPFVANPKQENADGDRYGDVCDNCPNVPNDGQENYDSDNLGDACDPDRDGDGCLNEVDQDPNSNQHRIGSTISPTCPDKSGVQYGWAGGNSDCDPRFCLGRGDPRDCEDLDDDNDGIPDDQDPCPIGRLPNSLAGDCTVLGGDCPRSRNDWWRTCLGGGCVQFYARVTDRINPDPTRNLILDRVSIVNQTAYLRPNIGVSVAATAKRIAGVRGIGLQADQPQLLRLELWRHATDTEPARLAAVVGDFDPTQVKLDQLELGSLLAFTPGVATEPPTLGAVWHVGDFPVNATLDTDGDGLPDGYELAHGLNQDNPDDAALDNDGDGVSNGDEFRAGTDPASPASRLVIRAGERDGGRFLVHLNGPVGRRVQLERTSDVARGTWTAVGAATRLQGDSATLIDDAGATLSQAFYRLRLLAD